VLDLTHHHPKGTALMSEYTRIERVVIQLQATGSADLASMIEQEFELQRCTLQAELKEADALSERLKLEAQAHAQEARTQKATVHEIYQAIGAQKGDWNGARPVIDYIERLKADSDTEVNELSERVLAMCLKRDWSMDWSARGCYLHLESSELIEALRGKGDSTPLDEAADVLLVLMSITENHGIKFTEVLDKASETCDYMMDRPPYKGEQKRSGYLDEIGGNCDGDYTRRNDN